MNLVDESPAWGLYIPLFLSVLLIAGIAGETVYRIAGPGQPSAQFVVGAMTNIPICIGIIVGVHKIRRSEVSRQYHHQFVGSSLGAAAVLTILIGIFTPLLYDSWRAIVAALRWSFVVGLGNGFVAGYLAAGLSEQRAAAERAAVRAKEATQRQELLEYLNALLRHEVLNTATVVGGRAAFLEEQRNSDPELVEHLEVFQRQADEMSNIVNDVRVLLKANEYEFDPQPIDVVSVVETEAEKIKDQYGEVQITVELPDRAIVRANDLLPRIFGNLFRNAVEHNHTSPPLLKISGSTTETHITIEIEDNGPGIPEYLREDLFTPSVNKLDDTHGLGTAIVGRLVEQYDGQIEITETGTKGTMITVELPLAPEKASEPTQSLQTVER